MRQTNIPKRPHLFFKWYCDEARYEELHGDLEEMFNERIERSGKFNARLHYCMDVIRCFQPYAWRRAEKQSSSLALFKSYLAVALRGLQKNYLNSFINVFGLSIAIGICILVYGFFQWDHDIDQFHAHRKEVFLITWLGDKSGKTQQYGTSPRPMATMLKDDFAHITKTCRVEDEAVVIKHGESVFYETLRFVDPEFLEMLTFPMKWGSAAALRDLNSIILNEEMAIRYFGNVNPVGQELLVKFNDAEGKLFRVGGVAAKFPRAHNIGFEFLANFENLRITNHDLREDDWRQMIDATLIQVDDAGSILQVSDNMRKYVTLRNEADHEQRIQSFILESLETLHAHASVISEAIVYDDNADGRVGLPVIAILMLTLACCNYLNIAIVSATRRLKEIGVRKTIGATNGKTIIQFLAENIIVTTLAMGVGFALCILIFIPWFEQFSGGEMLFDVYNINLFLFLAAVLVFTGIASGLYPAFYIARFETVKIFSGKAKFGRKNPATRIFLAVQLVLACVLIATGVVFTQNNFYQSNLNWGYDQKKVLFATLPDSTTYRRLSTIMKQNADVESIAGSRDHIGKSPSTVILRLPPARQYEADRFEVDAGYFKTMGLELREGRPFREHSAFDQHTIIVNQVMADGLRQRQVIGTKVKIDDVEYEIIGIVKDFHARNLFNPIRPCFFKVANEDKYHYLTLQVKSGTREKTYAALLDQWAKLFPESPFEGGFQEDIWGIYFIRVGRSEQFSIIIASIAVFLAAMGLFGLVTINVAGRTREFSIRKALGASTSHIVSVIANQYIILLGVSLAIGIPASYLFSNAALKMLFAYHMPVQYSGVAVAAIILLAIFSAVVATQVRTIFRTSSVEGLKVE